MARTTPARLLRSGLALGVVAALSLGGASAASADSIDGPVDLGTAAPYGVLAGSTVTNTGASVVDGDVGLAPGSAVTGFDGGPGVVNGVVDVANPRAVQAKADLLTAYGVATGLTPQETGVVELNGRSLSPGVYSGGAVQLADTGALTFAGSADSVWVIQAASTLTIGGATTMVFTGGASACNVFWQVGSSATIGSGAAFRGTVLADQSISTTAGATVVGRLLAQTGAVTLDTTTITVPEACPTAGVVSESPTITSGTPDDATVGTPYEFTVVATGTPAPTFAVTDGELPAGLELDAGTGVVSGTPTIPGDTTFTVTADNGEAPADSATYTVTVAAEAVVPPVLPPVLPPVVPPVVPPVTPVPPVVPPVTPAPPVGATPPGAVTPPGSVTPAGDVWTPAPVTVVDRSGRPVASDLAYTGQEAALPTAIGVAALLAGLGLVTAATVRRRRVVERVDGRPSR